MKLKQLRFKLEPNFMRHHANSAVFLKEGEDPLETLKEGIWQSIRLDLNVTIGEVTMFAAAWEDPEHWATEWVVLLGCDYDDVLDNVLAIINAHLEDTNLRRRNNEPQ